MREIKFRIWDGKRIVYDCGLAIKGNIILVQEKGKQNLSIPMQFTGFNDKNEKDIFEGDIVNFKGYLYIVEFSEINGWWCLVQPRKKDGNTLEEGYTGGVKGQDIFRCKIIGNIYENPELLEDKKYGK